MYVLGFKKKIIHLNILYTNISIILMTNIVGLVLCNTYKWTQRIFFFFFTVCICIGNFGIRHWLLSLKTIKEEMHYVIVVYKKYQLIKFNI